MKIIKKGQRLWRRRKKLKLTLICMDKFCFLLNWSSKESYTMWLFTALLFCPPFLLFIHSLLPLTLLPPFIRACIPSSFSPFLSALSSGSCFQKLSSDNKPLVWWLHLFLDTHNLFWMGLWRETQIELTTLFRACWIPACILKIKFQWLVSFEQNAKEFRIISVTRWRKFYSPLFFLGKALYAFGRITLINHFAWGLSPQSMLK